MTETRTLAQIQEDEFIIDLHRDIRELLAKRGISYRTGSYTGLHEATMNFEGNRVKATLSLNVSIDPEKFNVPPKR